MLTKSELTIYMTGKCNLNCKHCYRPNGHMSLSPDDLNWIYNNIKNKRTTLLGGEPLLHPNIKEAIDIFPQVTIATNGLLINEDNVDMLKGTSGVQLSLEMGKAQTEHLRGEGVWDKVFETAELLEKEGIDYYFRTSYYEGDIGYITEFIDLDVPLVLFPRVDKPAMNPQITSKLFEEVLNHENWILALPNFMQYLGKNGRCKAGSERLNVLYDKKITPCNLDLEYYLGKIGDDLSRIDKNIETFLANNKTLPPDCAGCKHAEVCHGSCYAAHASQGCPLKYNFDIQDYMDKSGMDKKEMDRQVGKMTSFMKKMLVC